DTMEVEEQVSRLCCDKTTPRNVELQKMKNVKSNDCKHKATETRTSTPFSGIKPLSETSVTQFQLAPSIICVHCNAKKFTGEFDEFRCSNGKIALVDVEMPTT
ncbi:1328_t:CDS:2, partial [Gigaspora rosea]